MSCVNYNAKVQSVGANTNSLLYILQVNLECADSGIKKIAHVEVECAKGEQLALSEDMLKRCWLEGHIISEDLSGQATFSEDVEVEEVEPEAEPEPEPEAEPEVEPEAEPEPEPEEPGQEGPADPVLP